VAFDGLSYADLQELLFPKRKKRPPTTLTDSLTTLSGGARRGGGRVVTEHPDAADVGGEYNPNTDEIFVPPGASREVVSHEFGHRYDRDGKLRAAIPEAATRPTGRHDDFDLPPEQVREESAADVFSNSVKFLQSEESRGPRAIEALGKYEAGHAGTGDAVRKLLSEPIYRDHPLRASIRPNELKAPPRIASDATRVAEKPRAPLRKPQPTIKAQSDEDRIINAGAKNEQRKQLARAISPIGAGIVDLAKSTFDAGKEARGQLKRGEYGKAALNTALNILPDGGVGEAMKVGGLTVGAIKGLKKAAGVIGDVAPKARPGFINPLGSRRKVPEGIKVPAALDDGADPRILNTSKLNLSQDAEDRLRTILPSKGEKTVITHEEQQTLAREWETVPEELKKALPQDWTPAQHLAAANIVSENMERIVSLSPKVTDFSIPLAEREAAQIEINRLTHDVTEFTGGISKSREAGGRRLNAMKILANRSMEPSTWIVQAERAKGVPLNTEEMASIHGFVKENDRAGLVKYVSDLYTPDPRDQVLGIWKAGLLTNPVTHVVNAVSNATMTAMETIKEPVALAADRLISLVRNERDADGLLRKTKAPSLGTITSQVRAIPGGLKEGVGEFKRVMKGEPNLAEKYDFRDVNYDNWFGGPIWNGYTRTVFGSLAGSDRVFRAMGVARSLEEGIRLKAPQIAKARGLDEKDIPALIDDLRKNPTDDLMLRAIEDAEYATFQGPNKAADAVNSAKSKLGPTGKAVADFAAPFVRTPANVTASLIDYSPLGLARVFKVASKELSIPDQKKLAENLGRSVTGSSLVMLGFMLAREGKATGAAPGAPGAEGGAADRAMWEEQHKQANSVKMGDKWVNVSRISPPGMLIALGAQMYHAAEASESIGGKAVGAAASVGRVAADQPFLTGPAGMLDVVNDPSRHAEKFAERTAGSIVPAGVAAVARGLDDTVRQPEGIAQTVASRIPGLSDEIAPKISPFGDDVKREGGLAGALLNPLPYRTENDDPLLAEMERLGLAPKFAGKTFKSNGLSVKRTPEEQRDFQRIYGWYQKRNLGMALNSPALATDEEKRDESERAITAARRSAGRDTFRGEQRRVAQEKKKKR
jgi:hypothetical protein